MSRFTDTVKVIGRSMASAESSPCSRSAAVEKDECWIYDEHDLWHCSRV